MGTWAFLLVVATGVVFGFLSQMIGTRAFRFEGLFTAIGAGLGALAGGRYLETWTTWGPSVDGLYILPALIGAVFVGAVFDGVMRAAAPLTPSTTSTPKRSQPTDPTMIAWSPD
jgi:uncharacterized membrane protein YeaQ/YmgE (transglycosylase-associated protein family)